MSDRDIDPAKTKPGIKNDQGTFIPSLNEMFTSAGLHQLQMSSLPPPETIRQVTDVKSLQEACLRLIQVCEKEADSKRKYRNSATVLKKEMSALEFEMKTLKEKNETLEAISREMMNGKTGDSEAEQELKKELDKQKVQIENLQSELELYRGKGQQLQELVASLNDQNQKLTEKQRNDEAELANQKILVQSLESQKDSLSKTIRLMEDQINQGSNDQNAVICHIQSEKEELEAKTSQIESQMATVNIENERLKQEIEAITLKMRDLEKTAELYEALQAEHVNLKATLNSEQQNSGDISNELRIMREKYDTAMLDAESARQKMAEMEKTIREQEKVIQIKETEQKELTEILKNNKEKAKERIHKLQSKNLEAEESAKKENELREEERTRLQTQIQSLSQLVENMTKERQAISTNDSETKAKIEKLEEKIREQNEEIVLMKREQDFMVMKFAQKEALIKELSDAKEKNAEFAKQMEELRIELFNQKTLTHEHERAHESIAEVIDDKNATIIKLKSLLSRSVKSEQRKQQQIDAIESERKQLLERFANLSSSPELFAQASFNGDEAKPSEELEIEELTTQNRKLQEMLEASRRLYSELQEKYRNIKRQNRHQQRLQFETCQVFDVAESLETRRKLKRMTNNAKREAKLVKSAYLRRVLLQYFSQEEDSDRNMMIPMILELVGCTREQTSMVMRQLERNQQLITRTAGFFGLLK